MTQRRGCGRFVSQDDRFLPFCLTCRESGIAASRRLKIRDEIAALDLDNAVTARLLKWDVAVKKNDARRMAAAIWGEGDDEDEVFTGDANANSLLAADPYADKDTMVW